MRIIPVLDLKAGLVVRAEGGRRDSYRPIATPLAASAEPVAVAEGLRRLAAFEAFYVADLDAIAGGPPQTEALAPARALVPRAGNLARRRLRRCREARRRARRPGAAAGPRQRIAARRGAARRPPRPSAAGPVARLLRRRLSRPAGDPRCARAVAAMGHRDDARTGRHGRRPGLRTACRDQGASRQRAAWWPPAGCAARPTLARLEALGIAAALVASALHDGSLMPVRPGARRCGRPSATSPKDLRVLRGAGACVTGPGSFSAGATDHPALQRVSPVRGCLLSRRRRDA